MPDARPHFEQVDVPGTPQWGAVVYLAWSSPRLRSKSATLTEVIDEHWHMLDEESEQ
jgi:hypothetical protein